MFCSAEAKATVNWVRESQTSQPRTSKRHLTTTTHCITFKTGFHVRSRCLKVGRVPRGLFPGAWVGAADLLGLVSHTNTVLKIKENMIVFLFLFLAIKTHALSARLLLWPEPEGPCTSPDMVCDWRGKTTDDTTLPVPLHLITIEAWSWGLVKN